MIDIPSSFYEGEAAIRVTLEQYIDLLEQFDMEAIPVWNPDFLTKWVKERAEEDGFVYVYWDSSDKMVSCFSIRSEDVYEYTRYEYKDCLIPEPECILKLQSVLDLLQ